MTVEIASKQPAHWYIPRSQKHTVLEINFI